MGYINLYIGSKATLNVKNNQIVIKTENEEDFFPCQDVNSVLLENQQTNISVYALNFLVENNCLVYICNKEHLPQAYLLGYNSYYKNLQVYQYQINAKKPFIKQLWADVVKNKIQNQAQVLNLLKIKNNLNDYAKNIKSADSQNAEAIVAAKYFKLLFGKDFARVQGNVVNSSLDYGYSIIRGCIARSAVSHGLQTFLGIHHNNKLNNFNLVDDLIEVFRPVVDLFVYENVDRKIEQLTPNIKRALYNLLNMDILLDGQKYCVSYAIEKYIIKFISCLKEQSNLLSFPTIINMQMHKYE